MVLRPVVEGTWTSRPLAREHGVHTLQPLALLVPTPVFRASLDCVAFAAPSTLVTGAAHDIVQEALAFDEFARKDVLFRNL